MIETYRVFFEDDAYPSSKSEKYDFSHDFVRVIDVRNADVTGTTDYIELVITSSDPDRTPDQELMGQLDDGLLENEKYRDVQKLIDGRWCRWGTANGELVWKPLTKEEE